MKYSTAVGLRTLVVGLGHSGANLHLPVLDRLRRDRSELFAVEPPLGCDPRRTPADNVVRTIAQAADRLDPRHTVVHVCTPPTERTGPLLELVDAGFTKVLVEKPLATNPADLASITALRPRLDLMVVSQWLTSALTTRIAALVRQPALGALTGIRFTQRKARFQRSSGANAHSTAFDVELPHSLGVALLLAGDAELTAARCWDLTADGWTAPNLGGARLALRHHGGVATEIVSDLGAPVRERCVEVSFERGTAVGHYPVGADDPYARLTVHTEDGPRTSVFPDDPLARFVRHAYRYFAGAEVLSFAELNIEVARLLWHARCRAVGGEP